MNSIYVITVVPIKTINQLNKTTRIKALNTIPNVNTRLLNTIKEFMFENVGYNNFPIACLKVSDDILKSGHNIIHYLPANSLEDAILVFHVPEDLVVSVTYQELLEMSNVVTNCSDDPDSLQLILEDFKELLNVGSPDIEKSEVLYFLPFLDLSYCKGYAFFDENFNAQKSKIKLKDVEHYSLDRLTVFIM